MSKDGVKDEDEEKKDGKHDKETEGDAACVTRHKEAAMSVKN